VSFRSRSLLTAAVGLGLAGAVAAQEPARLGVAQGQALKPHGAPSSNQQVADTIAHTLRQSALLQGYRVDINFLNGVAELSGAVTNQLQKDEALRIVQGVPGVERVRDRLTMDAPVPVQQVQAAMPAVGDVANVPMQAGMPGGPMMGAPMMGGPMMGGPMMGAPMMAGPYTVPSEPTPIMQVGYGSPYALNTPAMPPYAWPTYAPYNNHSRNATPTAYPANAWPFIGPPYPFPKVPLGWRKVQLEWQDGHWWFGKVAGCMDWWRLRYW